MTGFVVQVHICFCKIPLDDRDRVFQRPECVRATRNKNTGSGPQHCDPKDSGHPSESYWIRPTQAAEPILQETRKDDNSALYYTQTSYIYIQLK